jgi:hypothetical protein
MTTESLAAEVLAAETLTVHLAGFTGRPVALACHLAGDHRAPVAWPVTGGSVAIDAAHHEAHLKGTPQ